MIRFIDINTGNIFNGEQPYCFWFDKGQSTQLNYIKQICIISDKRKLICQIKNEGIFNFINLNSNTNTADFFQDIIVNQKKYKNLDELLIKPINNNLIYTSYGYKYEKYYIHMLYVYALSKDAGTFQQELNINDQKFLIGADFYNENEFLKSNLQNFGFEVPDVIQKAIYDGNIYEESRDNILLNRKFKELLIEYKNILMNKGSYKSLIDSLKWFEYGDLVKLQEFWEIKSLDKDILDRRNLSNLITDELKSILDSYKKTTYLGLYLALTKIQVDKDGHIKYEDENDLKFQVDGIEMRSAKLDKYLNEENPLTNRVLQIGNENVEIYNPLDYELPDNKQYGGSNWKCLDTDGIKFIPELNPKLEFITSKFSREELALKMTLLGNFYATYFMPIHLDLIHSTIEDIVFTNTFKLINFNRIERNDWFDNLEYFDCNLDNTNYLYLENIEVGVNKDTILGNNWKEGDNYGDVTLFGVDKLEDIKQISEKDIKTFYTQLYRGIGVIQPIECKIHTTPNDNGDNLNILHKIQISYEEISNNKYRKKKHHILTDNYIIKPDKKGNIIFNFNLLFKEAKEYNICICLYLNNSKTYIRNFKFHIYDNTLQDIDIYKLQKLTLPEINNVLSGYNYDWNLFAFSSNPSQINNSNDFFDRYNKYYTQYIVTRDNIDNVGLSCFYKRKLLTGEEQIGQFLINCGVPKEEIIMMDPETQKEKFILNPENYLKYHDLMLNVLNINSIPLKRVFTENDNFYGDIQLRNEIVLNNKNQIQKEIPSLYLYYLQKGFDNDGTNEYILINKNSKIYNNGIQWDCNILLKSVVSVDTSVYDDVVILKNISHFITFKYNCKKDEDLIKDNPQYNPGVNLEIYKNGNLIKFFTNIKPDENINIRADYKVDDNIKVVLKRDNNKLCFELNTKYKEVSFNPTEYAKPYFNIAYNELDENNDPILIAPEVDDEDFKPIRKFIPQFHKLIPLGDNYKISKGDIICFIPNFLHTLPLRKIYNDGKYIDEIKWEFYNESTNEIIIPQLNDDSPANINEPFVFKFKREALNPGYYNVKLNYNLGGQNITKTLNSCFYIEK